MKPLAELAAANVGRDTALTIGVFDGVHLGHRHLLRHVTGEARRHRLASAVVTFKNHPATVLVPGTRVTYLTSVEQRLELMRAAGIEHPVPLTFTRELSELTPRQFVAALIKHLRMRWLVCGPDFALGKGRAGTVPVLRELGKELGFGVTTVGPFTERDHVVSSTAIRQALAKGDVETAAEMLGRPYSLSGPVVAGDRRGHQLGFPTANIETPPDIALPADGIYCTVAIVDGVRRDSVTSVGVRPTFGNLVRAVETFVLDFDGDLYGKPMTIELIAWIRPEERFASAGALVAQIRRDVETARGVLAARVSS